MFVLAFVFIFAIIATTEFIEYFIEEENEEVVFVVSTIDKIQDALYDDRIEDVGDFYITYMPNPNSDYVGEDTAIYWLKDDGLLEFEVDFLNRNFRLPYDVEVVAKECGFENAFYDPST